VWTRGIFLKGGEGHGAMMTRMPEGSRSLRTSGDGGSLPLGYTIYSVRALGTLMQGCGLFSNAALGLPVLMVGVAIMVCFW